MKSEIVKLNGAYALKLDGKEQRYAGYRTWRPNAEYIKGFEDEGYNLMTVLPSGIKNAHGIPYAPHGEYWQGDGVYDFSILKRQIDDYAENAPGCRLAVNLMLDTRDWFLRDHPDCPNSFIYFSSAIIYEPWIRCAERMLKDTVDFLLSEYPDKLFAIFLAAGGTCEWHNKAIDFPRTEGALRHYREWCGDMTAEIPAPEEISSTTDQSFRNPEREANTVRFLKYFNEIITETLAHFAAYVKKITEGKILVGAAAGYLLCAENPLTGHSDIASVMDIDDIDLIACPASYFHRKLDGVTYSQASLDSVLHNGKLFVHSIDNATAAVNGNPYVQILQSAHCRHETMEQSINYARRECAFAMSKGAGFWFFDQYGGWYPDKASRYELSRILDAYGEVYSMPVSFNSEIAMVLDPTSCYYTDMGSYYKAENVFGLVDKLGRVGAPFDCFSVKDILKDSFDFSQYKLVIFPNLIYPSDEVRRKVSSLREMGISLLFLGHSGLVSEKGIDVSRASELVGINLSVDFGEEFFTLIDEKYTTDGIPKIYGGRTSSTVRPASWAQKAAPRPLLYADDSQAVSVATDFKSGITRLALKDRGNSFDAWSFRGLLPNEILDKLVERAGVFRYQTAGLPTYANSRMAAFFDHKGGVRNISFREVGEYREFFSGEVYSFDGSPISVSFAPDECKLFIPVA